MKLESPITVTYEPIGSRVLLSCPEQEDLSGKHVKEGGVLVPAGLIRPKSAFLEMTVEAAGKKCVQVKKGDIVIFNPQNAGAEKRGDGLEYRWTEEQFIIAVVRRKLNALPTQTPAVD